MFMANKILSEKDAGEFSYTLHPDDAFLTVNHPNGKVLGKFFSSLNINDKELSVFMELVKNHFKGDLKGEIKLIANAKTLNIFKNLLNKYASFKYKMVTRERNSQIIFEPSHGRLRAEIENVLEIKSD
jgi:hypothetical protein